MGNQSATGSRTAQDDFSGPPAAAPSTVRTAYGLWLAHAAVFLVVYLMIFVHRDEKLGGLAGIATQFSDAGVDSAGVTQMGTTVFLVVLILVTLVHVGLTLLVAAKMQAGRNWARILLSIVAALTVVGVAQDIGTPDFDAVGLAAAIIALAATVFMWLKPSNAYFASRR